LPGGLRALSKGCSKESRGEQKSLMDTLEKTRAAGAEAAGIVKDRKKALKESPVLPQIAFVRPSVDYI